MNGRLKRTEQEPSDGPLSDGRLLGRFVDHDDGNAFAELVSRYCGLVMGVCRRVLRDEQTAEDAFQATFLVLARRAAKIRRRSSPAGWLYAVAYRTARRAGAKRLRRREEPLSGDMATTDDTLAEVASRFEQELLDEELQRLPAKYREPLVLRYLLGKSNQEVAGELGLSVGIVEGRLKRGKDRLRVRLARRGVGLGGVLAAVGLSSAAAKAATADSLVAATVDAASVFRSGAKPGGSDSQAAIELAEKELFMSTSTITTCGVAAALVIAGLAFGLAGEGGRDVARAQAPEIHASAAMPWAAALLAEGELAPVSPPASEHKAAAAAATTTAPATDSGADNSAPPPSEAGSSGTKWWTPVEERIIEALETPTQLEFIDQPLQDIVDFLRDAHQIEILIDTRALEDIGVALDTPVTVSLRGLRLRSALGLMLRELDLTWTIHHEVLLITSHEMDERMLITKVYDVSDLVICRDASGEEWADYETLIEVITRTIEPTSWDAVGGPCSIVAAPLRGAEMLAVAQTLQIHLEIERLVEQLRAVAGERGGSEPPVREKPKKPQEAEVLPRVFGDPAPTQSSPGASGTQPAPASGAAAGHSKSR